MKLMVIATASAGLALAGCQTTGEGALTGAAIGAAGGAIAGEIFADSPGRGAAYGALVGAAIGAYEGCSRGGTCGKRARAHGHRRYDRHAGRYYYDDPYYGDTYWEDGSHRHTHRGHRRGRRY